MTTPKEQSLRERIRKVLSNHYSSFDFADVLDEIMPVIEQYVGERIIEESLGSLERTLSGKDTK